jgi:hypothetical protein
MTRTELALALAAVFAVIVVPFALVTYPPMTDLPFHAAAMSIFRHYLDPAWHFREQFELRPLAVPYLTTYGLGAGLDLVLPIRIAVKCVAIAMLGLFPVGLGVLFHGMKKSPLWGLLGLGLVWNTLTHWGFLNYVGAIGLFAMVIGCTLLLVDRPTRARQVALGVALLTVLITHLYRFPSALAGALLTGLVMYPATRRFRPILAPVGTAAVLFVAWWYLGGTALGGWTEPMGWHLERWREMPDRLFGAFDGGEERRLAAELGAGYGMVLLASTAFFFMEGRHRRRSREERWWGIGVTLVPLGGAVALLCLYFVLPMSMGVWAYVYPRELLAAALLGLGVMPDLPRPAWQRWWLVGIVTLLGARIALHTAEKWRAFENQTADFRAVLAAMPPAPKLMYLVYQTEPGYRVGSPYMHLPAWVQAERGGWLSFHFASFGASPFRYRRDTNSVPPPLPRAWEWKPRPLRVLEEGRWFDTFLVRMAADPGKLFAPDPTVRQVAHAGSWWLYRRVP